MVAIAPPTESDRAIAQGLKLLLQRSGLKVSRIIGWDSDGKKLTGTFIAAAPRSPQSQRFEFSVDDKGFTYEPAKERSDAKNCSGKASLPCGDSCISDEKSCRIKDALSVRMGQQLIKMANGSKLGMVGTATASKPQFSLQGKQIEVSEDIRKRGATAVVEEVERQIRDCEYEVMAAIDPKTGELLFQKQGGQVEIEFTDEEVKKFKGAIITHNHPDLGNPPGTEIFKGSPFSPDDIALAAINEVAEVRAVGHENVYSLKPPDGGWNKDFYIEKIAPTLNRQYADGYSEMVAEMRKDPWMDEGTAMNNHIHRTLVKSAKETGFKYEKKQNRKIDREFENEWGKRDSLKKLRQTAKKLAVLGLLAIGSSILSNMAEAEDKKTQQPDISQFNKSRRDANESVVQSSPEVAQVGRQIKAIAASVYQKPLRLHAFDLNQKGEAIGVFSGDGELYKFTANPNTGNFRYVEVEKNSRTDAYMIGWIVDGGMLLHDRQDRATKKCSIGKQCGDACIEKGRECSIQLQPKAATALKTTAKQMSALKEQGQSFPGGAILAKVFTGAAIAGVAAGAAYAISKRQQPGQASAIAQAKPSVEPSKIAKSGRDWKKAAIVTAGVIGVPTVAYLGARARYQNNLNKGAEDVLRRASEIEVDSVKERQHTIVFGVGGMAYADESPEVVKGERIVTAFKLAFSRDKGKDMKTVPIDNADSNVPKGRKRGGKVDQLVDVAKIHYDNFKKGNNPTAIEMAAQVVAYSDKYPDKQLVLAGHSYGGMVIAETEEYLKRTRPDIAKRLKSLSFGTEYFGMTDPKGFGESHTIGSPNDVFTSKMPVKNPQLFDDVSGHSQSNYFMSPSVKKFVGDLLYRDVKKPEPKPAQQQGKKQKPKQSQAEKTDELTLAEAI